MDIGAHFHGSSPPGQKESKQDRSGLEDCFQRNSKLLKTTTQEQEQEQENLSSSPTSSLVAEYYKTMSFHQGIPLMRSSASLISSNSRRQEHMLSFSDKQEPPLLDFNNKNSPSPFLHQIPSPYCKIPGGMMMNMSMQGNIKGPFTLTQWAELEQQALIFKYITANVPVPSSLLISIKKSFYPYGSLPPTSFGWGPFHLGYVGGGNMDPEPGRCRRTDGKKWRCSKDAVIDQKYCERHINRGRHRSRKLVEVQSGLTATAAASKAAIKPQQQPVVAGASSKRSLAIGGQQYTNPSTDSLPNNRVRNLVYPSTVNLQPKEAPLAHQKQRNNNNPYEFGHISSDSLLNPNSVKSYGSSSSSAYLDFSSNQDNKHSGNHNSWPEEMKPDWTQLSMSIPIASSSTSSTHNNNNNNNNNTQDKIATVSPLRLSREYDLSIHTEPSTVKKTNTWIPISWGNSLGGPLGEVLNSTTNSPTGVLQKSTFCSLSNSSSVSSPVTENNNNNNRNNNNAEFFHYTT